MDTDIYYTLPNIYGIRINNYIDGKYDILFEKKYNTKIDNEIINESKMFYHDLDEIVKKNVTIQIYRKCKSIDNDEETCMVW